MYTVHSIEGCESRKRCSGSHFPAGTRKMPKMEPEEIEEESFRQEDGHAGFKSAERNGRPHFD